MDKMKTNYFHTTDVKELAIDGTTVTSTAAELNIMGGITASVAELNKMDGVESTAAELDSFVLRGEIVNISSAASTWVVSPYAATVERVDTVIDGAITVGDAEVTLEIATVLVTGSAVTIAHSGSAAGTTDSSTPSAANTVAAGGSIEIITDGGSTDAARAIVMLTMQRT